MGNPQQLHDRDTSSCQTGTPSSLDAQTAQLIGRLAATVEASTAQTSQLTKAVEGLVSSQQQQRLDMQKYWSGLEKANADIISCRDEVKESRKEVQALPDKIEHIVAANIHPLGIDLRDADAVEEWRDVLTNARKNYRAKNSIQGKVTGAIAVVIALAICAAAWDGISSKYLSQPSQSVHSSEDK